MAEWTERADFKKRRLDKLHQCIDSSRVGGVDLLQLSFWLEQEWQ
jgi:hypothetical protein